MRVNPHLVLDGVAGRGRRSSARGEVVVAVGRDARCAQRRARPAHRRARASAADARAIRLVAVPDRFVAGEESALVHWLNGGPAKPTFTPPRPFERGVRGRPTLVQNVETLAHLGADRALRRRLVPRARHRGRARARRSSRVRGAVARPGVVEVALGTPLRAAGRRAAAARPQPARRVARRRLLRHLGAGAERARRRRSRTRACGRSAPRSAPARSPCSRRARAASPRPRASLATWPARAPASAAPASSGCAPSPTRCDSLAVCDAGARGGALERLPRLAPQIAGRGACAHPDGAVRLVESALARVRATRSSAPPRRRLLARARASRCLPIRRRAGGMAMSRSRTTCASTRSCATPTATAPSCCPS